ncbi:MAG: helix-turn-helix transcriptional regulator [Clostridiales bacterium]|nr:helix-turn-helix transcriptional regulator [Clostridiales bacterium]
MATETQLLKGVLEGCILGLLKDEASYGYLIVEKLKAYGFQNIQEASVYPILKRLEKKELLQFEKRPSEVGPPRKYYLLTKQGEHMLETFIDNYKNIRKNVDNVFKEEIR